MERYKRKYRAIALMLLGVFAINLFVIPTQSYALTSGPSQPEVSGFTSVSATDMVDLFTGNFSYNIPLMEVPGPDGGYPINISYGSGISPEQEASWVGLGWKLNVGAVEQQMRGIPDEFDGDAKYANNAVKPSYERDFIYQYTGMRPQITTTYSFLVGAEFLGFLGLSRGNDLIYSNYTGHAIGMNFGLSLGIFNMKDIKMLDRVGLNIGLRGNSEQGGFVDTSISLHGMMRRFQGTLGWSQTYSNRQGTLGSSLFLNLGIKGSNKSQMLGDRILSYPLTFSNIAYTPEMGVSLDVHSFSAKFKLGKALKGAYPYGEISFNQSVQSVDKPYEKVPAYGYFNTYKGVGKGVMDINREQEGTIFPESPALPMPQMTYDVYNVTSQTGGGSFRPILNAVNLVGDREIISKSTFAGGGADVSIPIVGDAHIGANFIYNQTTIISAPWLPENLNIFKEIASFSAENPVDEPFYFRNNGEFSSMNKGELANWGGDKPVYINFSEEGQPKEFTFNTNQVANSPSGLSLNSTKNNRIFKNKLKGEREYRNNILSLVRNQELGENSNNPLLGEYYVSYYDEQLSISKVYKRLYEPTDMTGFNANDNLEDMLPYLKKAHPKHHIAGFTQINTSGVRQVYALPAYNNYQIEHTFAVVEENDGVSTCPNYLVDDDIFDASGDAKINSNSLDLYEKKIETGPYPYAFMLTSILGQDYVDVDKETNPGPSDADLGYWVKFNYRKVSDNYGWRAPIAGATQISGALSNSNDNKAYYMYGEKELWYVGSIETKSHIAIFEVEDRQDGTGVDRLGNIVPGSKQKRLKSIKLYTKEEYYNASSTSSAVPIKTVKFEHDYSLCKSTPNSQAASQGKLTLKKVWFEYQNSTKGAFNPYVFSYYSEQDYEINSSNPWGLFQGAPSDMCLHNFAPYVNQEEDKATRDEKLSTWSLKQIQMPSGATINIDYESDDYAYVQNKRAMQMQPFVLGEEDSGTASLPSGQYNIGGSNDYIRVYFPLDEVDSGLSILSEAEQREIVNLYLDDTEQLFFKYKINLRQQDGMPINDEIVSVYVDIEPDDVEKRGLYAAAGSSTYTHGFVTIKKIDGWHPLKVAAWEHLRTNYPRLLVERNSIDPNEGIDGGSLKAALQAVGEVFTSYYKLANKREWASQFDTEYSHVRLNNRTGIKYGGGLRVKQITLSDRWKETTVSPEEYTYGQVYEYTTKDENGHTISSGVATYEPHIMGDENALKHGFSYVIEAKVKSKNRHYVELPINQNYYPSASVGYSKVTVRSLASASLAEQDVNNYSLPDGLQVGTTGLTVSEFYTAKDFPVISKMSKVETAEKNSYKVFKIERKFYASQGFTIELNDMHGKPKSQTSYAQKKDGSTIADPVSYVKYFYKEATSTQGNSINKRSVRVPNNECEVLVSEQNGIIQKDKNLVGVDKEIIIDTRRSVVKQRGGGLAGNVDLITIPPIPFPIPSIWPNVNRNIEEKATIVVNKIIHRSGILERVETFDGNAINTAENLLWDLETGQVVLSAVTNPFGDKIFSYNIPAHTQYKAAGGAYKNIGLRFKTELESYATPNKYRTHYVTWNVLNAEWFSRLIAGDEFIIYDDNSEGLGIATAIYMGRDVDKIQFYIETTASTVIEDDQEYGFLLSRSGHRNLLSLNIGSIVSKLNPCDMENRNMGNFPSTIIIPENK
jgi:hypothetical protein